MLKKLLALLLALAMVFCLVACDSGSKDNDDEDEKKSDKGDKDTDEGDEGPAGVDNSDWIAYEISGLSIKAPEAYYNQLQEDNYLWLNGEITSIEVRYYDSNDWANAQEYVDYIVEGLKDWEINAEAREINGVHYVFNQEEDTAEAELTACFVAEDGYWTVKVTTDDYAACEDEILAILSDCGVG